MCTVPQKPRRRGLSMVETIVASTLMFIVLGVVYMFTRSSYHHFRLIQSSSQAQQELLALLSKLNSTLQNTRPEFIYVDPTNKGVSFASPFALNGQVSFKEDTVTKEIRIEWPAYECIYVNGSLDAKYGRRAITPPSISITAPNLAGATPASFILAPGALDKLLCHSVSKMEIKEYKVGDILPRSGLPAEGVCFGIGVEVGSKADVGGYWLRLESVVTPRNK